MYVATEDPASTTASEAEEDGAAALEARMAELRRRKKRLSRTIGRAKQRGEPIEDLLEEARLLSQELKELATQAGATAEEAAEPSAPAAEPLVVTVESSPDQFRALRDEWNDLLFRSHCESPFLTWEWLYTWWEAYGADKGLYVVLVRSGDGELIGAAPLMLGYRDFRDPRRFDRRTLAFLGTGECLGPNYLEFIAAPERQGDITRAVLDRVMQDAAHWDMVLLRHVPCEQGEQGLLSQIAADERLYALVEGARGCVWGPLPQTFEEYLDALSSKRRRRYLRVQDELLRSEFEQVEFSSCPPAGTPSEYVQALIELHLARFGVKGEASAWDDARVQRMMHKTAERFHERGWLRVDRLELNGQAAASMLGFVFKGRYFVLQTGFRDEFAAVSPIHALCGYRIRQLIEEKARAFDFLGGAYEFKRQYFDNLRYVTTVRLFPESPRGRFAAGWRLATQSALPAAREALTRLLRGRRRPPRSPEAPSR